MLKKIVNLSLIGSCVLSASSLANTQSDNEIDVLLLYTDNAVKYYKDSDDVGSASSLDDYIDHLFAHTNRVYRTQGVDAVLNKKKVSKWNTNLRPKDADLDTLSESKAVAKLRKDNKADLVVLLGDYHPVSKTSITCGIAWLGESTDAVPRDWGFSIVAADCAANTFAHEIGHNMGLTHSFKQGSKKGGHKVYGKGHGKDDSFTTIMAYPQAFGSATRLSVFSDPDISTCDGHKCGVSGTGERSADAVRALNHVVADVAEYF